jgi:ribosomal protein S20
VADGDGDRIAEEHRELVRWIDKAAAQGALHRNAAARKKAQAAKLVSGGGSGS